LIGGVYQQQDNIAALDALMAAWAAALSYQERINGMTSTTGSLGNYALTDDTILDDGVVDYLYGDQQQDWFLTSSLDVADRRGTEE
jgi:hypothetical protein